VHTKINRRKNKAGGCFRDAGMPAAPQDGDVVIPMQQDQLLLVDNDKKGIEQFHEFRRCEQKTPKGGGSLSEDLLTGLTDIILPAVVIKVMRHRREQPEKSPNGKDGQEQIPAR